MRNHNQIKNIKVIGELRRIAHRHRGVLRPEAVVEEARSKSSPLHNKFNWDDSTAGHQYRLWQARQLIGAVVQLAPVRGDARPVAVFTSMGTGNKRGYRETAVILANRSMRQQLLEHALEDLQRIEERYQHLRELAAIFEKSREVRSRFKRKDLKQAA